MSGKIPGDNIRTDCGKDDGEGETTEDNVCISMVNNPSSHSFKSLISRDAIRPLLIRDGEFGDGEDDETLEIGAPIVSIGFTGEGHDDREEDTGIRETESEVSQVGGGIDHPNINHPEILRS